MKIFKNNTKKVQVSLSHETPMNELFSCMHKIDMCEN